MHFRVPAFWLQAKIMWIDVEPKKRRVKEQKIVGDSAINYCSPDSESRGLRTPCDVCGPLWRRGADTRSLSFPFLFFFLPRCIFFLFCFAVPFIVCPLSHVESGRFISVLLYLSHVIIFRRSARSYFRRLHHPFRTSWARYVAFSCPLIVSAYYQESNPILLSLVSLASFVRSGAYLQRVGSLGKVPFDPRYILWDACTCTQWKHPYAGHNQEAVKKHMSIRAKKNCTIRCEKNVAYNLNSWVLWSIRVGSVRGKNKCCVNSKLN